MSLKLNNLPAETRRRWPWLPACWLLPSQLQAAPKTALTKPAVHALTSRVHAADFQHG